MENPSAIPTHAPSSCSSHASMSVLRLRLCFQHAAKIITGEFVIRVDPQRGSEVNFCLVQLSQAKEDDSQTTLGFIVVRVEPPDVLKGFPGLRQPLLAQING